MARSKRRKNKATVQTAIPKRLLAKGLFYVLVALVLVTAAYLFLGNSPYFELEDIEVIDKSGQAALDTGELLAAYEGRNIFGIDIYTLSSRIKTDTPSVKYAVVRRVLPNKLEIDIIPRIPVAKIKSLRYFPIDRSGIVLSPEINTGKLPVIIGFSAWLRPKVGSEINNPEIKSAFLLLDAMEEDSSAADYAVSTIDVSNHKNLSFYLESGIEIKIGSEDFPERLKKLNTILSRPGLDKENIKYIDLRFKDVVIGPK